MLTGYRSLVSTIFICLLFACDRDDERICKPHDPPSELDEYIFPLVPGMPGWADLESGEEMYAVTQLPDSVLPAITTAGLVETCYNYPLRLNMIAGTTLQNGVASVVDLFNGFQELSGRHDAASTLLERYAAMDPACLAGLQAGPELGDHTLSYSLFEAVIAQDIFLTKFSEVQQRQLLQLALEHHSKKKRYADIYGAFGLKTTAIIMARLMVLNGYPPFLDAMQQDSLIEIFVRSIELQDRLETIDIVAGYAISYNNH